MLLDRLRPFILVIALASTVAHASLICTGTGRLNTFDGKPEPRPLIAEIFGCQTLLNPGTPGRFTLEMGGDPIVFEGPLYLDGSREHRYVAVASGDVTSFRLDYRDEERLILEVDFLDADFDLLGGVERVTLRCQRLPQ